MLPILYQSPNLVLYTYPLLMGLGWGVAYQIFLFYSDLSKKYSNLIFWGLFIASWIGSKILFFITTNSLEMSTLRNVSFWTGGGFVFYGGLIAGAFYLLVYRLLKFPITFESLRSLLIAMCVGHAIGRIGCFLAGCCFGAPTEHWWGIHLHGVDRHPTQLFESFGLWVLAFVILKTKKPLNSFVMYLLGYGMLRFAIEALRGDEIRGQWGLLTPAQWISLILFFLGGILIFLNNFKMLRLVLRKKSSF